MDRGDTMTTAADQWLTTMLKEKTTLEIVNDLWDTAITSADDPVVQVFGTPAALKRYLACYATEIERRIAEAEEKGKMSIVRSL
jgi:hypothetical protein